MNTDKLTVVLADAIKALTLIKSKHLIKASDLMSELPCGYVRALEILDILEKLCAVKKIDENSYEHLESNIK